LEILCVASLIKEKQKMRCLCLYKFYVRVNIKILQQRIIILQFVETYFLFILFEVRIRSNREEKILFHKNRGVNLKSENLSVI
jgi:hypothetical protein